MLDSWMGRGQKGSDSPGQGRAWQHPPAGDRTGAGRRRRTRLCPYRHHPDAGGPRHHSQRRGRHLDRRRGRRRLCRRTSRHAGGMGAQPAAANCLLLSRHPPERLRPDRRRQACGRTRDRAGPEPDRGSAGEICHRCDRSAHRPRDLADPWPDGGCDACLLRVAREYSRRYWSATAGSSTVPWSIRCRCRRRARSARRSSLPPIFPATSSRTPRRSIPTARRPAFRYR